MMQKSWQNAFRLVVGIIVGCANWIVSDSNAQNYPVKGVRMIMGFPLGGGTDTAARFLVQKLSQPDYLGQPVIIENRPGASGAIASEMVARSPADGYTLLMMASAETIQPALRAKLPYDIERDFMPISLAGTNPFVRVVHPSHPVRNVKQLIALARAHPGELTYGTSGVGSPAHLMSEFFNSSARTKLTQVPYKGSAQIGVAVASGEITMSFVAIPAVKPLLADGRIRALGISTAQRSSLLPSVPALDEAALPGFDMIGSWCGVVAPVGVPRSIVAQLNTLIGKALRAPDIVESLNKQGIEPQPNTPEQLATLIRSEIALNTRLIRSHRHQGAVRGTHAPAMRSKSLVGDNFFGRGP